MSGVSIVSVGRRRCYYIFKKRTLPSLVLFSLVLVFFFFLHRFFSRVLEMWSVFHNICMILFSIRCRVQSDDGGMKCNGQVPAAAESDREPRPIITVCFSNRMILFLALNQSVHKE